MAKSRAPRRPLWLIANQENGRMGVFTLRSDDDREVLPVFSFEEEAEAFLWLGTPETGWRVRETTAGELISLLYGPCAGVKKVALDPLPVVDGEVIFDLAGWGRKDFLQNFVSAPLVRNHVSRAEVTIGPDFLESLDGRGMPSRETEEENGYMKKGDARSKTGRTRDEAPNGTDGAAIPNYMIRDFGFLEEAGENRVRGRE